eukprot:85137_1
MQYILVEMYQILLCCHLQCRYYQLLPSFYPIFCRKKEQNSTAVKYELHFVKKSDLTDNEKVTLFQKKECKKALNKLFSAALKIDETLLQFGKSRALNNGLIINILQFIFHSELNQHRTTKSIILDLYEAQKKETEDALSKHFGFDGDIMVIIHSLNSQFQEMSTVKSSTKDKIVNIVENIEKLLDDGMGKSEIKQILVERGFSRNLVMTLLNEYNVDKSKENTDLATIDKQFDYQRLND